VGSVLRSERHGGHRESFLASDQSGCSTIRSTSNWYQRHPEREQLQEYFARRLAVTGFVSSGKSTHYLLDPYEN
jgi:hypothetical protein